MAHSGPHARRKTAWILASILLLIAVLGTLVVPIYARSTPALGDFPFFYWYQLLWVPVVGILAGIAYLVTGDSQPAAADDGPPPGRAPGGQPGGGAGIGDPEEAL